MSGMQTHLPRIRHLRLVDRFDLPMTTPFNFRYTFWKPSHFPTQLEIHTPDVSWRSFRLGKAWCGVRFQADRAHVTADVFTSGKWSADLRRILEWRIRRAYGFDDDLGPVLRKMNKHHCLRGAVSTLEGMRISCPENAFEIAVISLLLQNTTIRRSEQMMSHLMRSYGGIVKFDACTLRAFFSPIDLKLAQEQDLRMRCRLGYRAKYLPRFAEFFTRIAPERLVEQPVPEIVRLLEEVPGVGPYTSGVIASSALRDANSLAIDVWNRRILAQRIFGDEDMPAANLLRRCRAKFPGFAGLAALYLIEYEYILRPLDPLLPDVDAVRRKGQGLADENTAASNTR